MAQAKLLSWVPRPQFLDNNGDPLNGGQVFFYEPGTSTKKDTYTDSTKGTANANPVILDSAGRPDSSGTPIDIYLDGSYKIVATASTDTDPPAAAIWTEDNVSSLFQPNATSSKAVDYTVLEADNQKSILVDASAAQRTITLIAAATAGDGFVIDIKKVDSSSNSVVLDGNASETIDGATTYSLVNQYDSVRIICDGSNWHTLNASRQQTFLDTNGNEVLEFTTTTSAVNNIGIVNAATGNNPIIRAKGEADTGITFDNSEGEEILILDSVASSVNELTITSAATGDDVSIAPTGGDTNIDLLIDTKGSGSLILGSPDTTEIDAQADIRLSQGDNLIFEGATADAFETTITVTDPTADRTITLPDASLSQFLLQEVRTTLRSSQAVSTQLPWDNSIPQSSEGSQIMTASITPSSASNILVIEYIVHAAMNAAGTICAALFQDATAGALDASAAYVPATDAGVIIQGKHVMTSGTTSSTTFSIRVGPNPAQTVTINGSAGTGIFGGVITTSIVVKEYTS